MAIKKYTYYLKSTYELLTAFADPFLMISVFTGLYRHSTPFEVRLRASGLRFLVRGKMDIWSLKETIIDRFYERFGFKVVGEETINGVKNWYMVRSTKPEK